jgi:hypothetical protein
MKNQYPKNLTDLTAEAEHAADQIQKALRKGSLKPLSDYYHLVNGKVFRTELPLPILNPSAANGIKEEDLRGIYVLFDPVTKLAAYVGKSNHLRLRLKQQGWGRIRQDSNLVPHIMSVDRIDEHAARMKVQGFLVALWYVDLDYDRALMEVYLAGKFHPIYNDWK